MNAEIRRAVKDALRARNMTRGQLAERLGVTPQSLSRTLNERGKVPGLWGGVLDELGLVLTVRPADAQGDGAGGQP